MHLERNVDLQWAMEKGGVIEALLRDGKPSLWMLEQLWGLHNDPVLQLHHKALGWPVRAAKKILANDNVKHTIGHKSMVCTEASCNASTAFGTADCHGAGHIFESWCEGLCRLQNLPCRLKGLVTWLHSGKLNYGIALEYKRHPSSN